VVFLVYCLALKAGYLPQQASAILLWLAVEAAALGMEAAAVLVALEKVH
jgi:hypothetical protein